MKQFFFLMVLLPACSFSMAQNNSKQFKSEEIRDGEYSIRILPAPGNTFGYDILEREQVILHQLFNPFSKSSSISGLKNNAYVIVSAKWLVKESKRIGKLPPSTLPDKVDRI